MHSGDFRHGAGRQSHPRPALPCSLRTDSHAVLAACPRRQQSRPASKLNHYLAEKTYSSDHTHAVSFPFQVLLLATVCHGHSGFFQPTLCMEHAHEACHSLPVFLDSLLSNDAHILIGRGENSAPLIVPAVHNVDSPRRGAAAHRYSQHLWYAIRSKLEETLY